MAEILIGIKQLAHAGRKGYHHTIKEVDQSQAKITPLKTTKEQDTLIQKFLQDVPDGRGYNLRAKNIDTGNFIVNEFSYITNRILITPVLTNDKESYLSQEDQELLNQDIYKQLSSALKFTDKFDAEVVGFLNKHHGGSYIMYNFSEKQQLVTSGFQHVMDYPLPGFEKSDTGLHWTVPPTLDRLMMIILEMSAWLDN